jgi:hypothetical protein
MKILAIEYEVQNTRPEAFSPCLRSEAAKAWDLYQAGVIRELYFRQDRPQAVLILECENTEAARELLGSLPLVQEKLIAFDLIPLRPYPGFSRLFTSEK